MKETQEHPEPFKCCGKCRHWEPAFPGAQRGYCKAPLPNWAVKLILDHIGRPATGRVISAHNAVQKHCPLIDWDDEEWCVYCRCYEPRGKDNARG